MILLRDISALDESLRGGAVTIGNFDGVHRGHARIVERLLAQSRQLGGPAVVFTFDPHPVRLLRPEHAPPPLTWTDRKAELLAELGVDAMLAYPTDAALLALSPEDFFDSMVREKLAARGMVEGDNFRFGHRRVGDVRLLRQLCAAANVALDIVEPLVLDGEPVSSSRVRRLLAAGDVDGVTKLLTRPYRLRGLVTHGVGRGAQIGFPTANLEGIDTLLPAVGVYAGQASVGNAGGDALAWPAAINVGPNPTFGEGVLKVEVHCIGCGEPLYGRVLQVDFRSRLRDVRPFDSVEELQRQLARDVERAQHLSVG